MTRIEIDHAVAYPDFDYSVPFALQHVDSSFLKEKVRHYKMWVRRSLKSGQK